MTGRLGLALACGLTLLAAAPARAQSDGEAPAAETPTCAEGREATERSQGRCCWPGQGWSEPYGRCSGPPRCPAPLVAEGDDCIAPMAPPSPTPPPASGPPPTVVPPPPSGPPPVSWAAVDGPRPRGGLNPELVATPDEGWMIFGGVSFAVGWVFSIVTGSLTGLAAERCEGLGAYAFIPLVGGLVHAATLDRCDARTTDPGLLLGPYVPASVAQLGGLVAFLVAVIANDAEALELESLSFGAPPGAEVGLALEGAF